MNLTEQAILAAWRLQQIELGDTIDETTKEWINDAIEILKQLAKKVK